MKPTRAQLRDLKRENERWPAHLIEVPPPWPMTPDFGTGSLPVRVMRSREFLLVVWDQGGTMRLSVMRTDFNASTRHQRDGVSWDDLQRLKGEAGYGDACAVEIFPPEARVVNVANMRHLFIVPLPAFAW